MQRVVVVERGADEFLQPMKVSGFEATKEGEEFALVHFKNGECRIMNGEFRDVAFFY